MRAKCRHFVYQFVADIYADIVPKIVILLKLHSIQTTAAYKVAYPYCVRIWTFLQKGIATPKHRLPDKTPNFDNFVNPKTDKTVDFSDFVGLKADRNAYFGNFVDQSTKYTHTKRTALMRCRPFALRYFFLRALICLYEYCFACFYALLAHYISSDLSAISCNNLAIKSSCDICPRSPFLRLRTDTICCSRSFSPSTSIYGIFCNCASRIR